MIRFQVVGAILFLAMICGLILAGGVHAAKATVRPVVTGTNGGTLNPAVSPPRTSPP